MLAQRRLVLPLLSVRGARQGVSISLPLPGSSLPGGIPLSDQDPHRDVLLGAVADP
jgi:hypothetical protein